MFSVKKALLASFGQKARKPIMRSTAYARYRTTNGCYGKLRARALVRYCISPECLMGEMLRDIVNTLYCDGDFVCEIKLITKEEYEEY